jgi:hypothetical protein
MLRHTDPSDPILAPIVGNGHAASIVFAMSGSNLFLFQTRRRAAAILMRKTIRRTPMEAGVVNGKVRVGKPGTSHWQLKHRCFVCLNLQSFDHC